MSAPIPPLKILETFFNILYIDVHCLQCHLHGVCAFKIRQKAPVAYSLKYTLSDKTNELFHEQENIHARFIES